MIVAKKVKMVWAKDAITSIRTSPEALDLVEAEAEAMAFRAGEGYEAKDAKVTTGRRKRARAAVVTTNFEAIRDNARNHTLTRVLGGG